MPYSLRGAAYGTLHVPVDAEYEIRFRYYNYRGGNGDVVADQADAPARGTARGRGAATGSPAPGGAPDAPVDPAAAAGRGRTAGAGPGRGGAATPRPPQTPEQRAAAIEAARKAAPPEPVVFTFDGAQVYTYTVEGNGGSDYAHGDDIFRSKLTAGDHAVRVSFPALANLANPRTNVNPDLRRRLSIGYIDVIGPFTPSTAPPSSYRKVFICGERTQACARQIIENLVTRAYRRPATSQEVQKLLGLAAQVQKRDSFDESIRVVLDAVLMSPNFLFRIEQDRPDFAPRSYGGQARGFERLPGQRLRAGVASLVFPLEHDAGRRAVSGGGEEDAAGPGAS